MTKSLKKNVFLSNAQRYEMYNHYIRSMQSSNNSNKIKDASNKDTDDNDQTKMKKDGGKSKVQKTMTYEELINWAVDRYQLNRRPNKSTISRLITRIEEERASGGPGRKPNVSRIQKGRFPEIEEAVLEWMDINESKRIPMSWTMIMQKASKVAEQRGIDFKGSNGWMDRFVARHDLKKRLVKKKVNKPITSEQKQS